jgi:putative membrane protein
MFGRNYPLLFAKGMAMGAADVVPGVSGGTIAFISGIYDELVDSLRALGPGKLVLLVREGPRAFWAAINGSFLLTLFSGVLASIFSLAKLVEYLLRHQPVMIWSFFFGLILASILYVGKQQSRWGLLQLAAMAVGTLLAAASAFAPSFAVEITPLTLFFSGMIAICAMILPGVSGSFLLLLIGVYGDVIKAVTELNFPLLLAFAAGAGLGLVVFSRFLSWLLHHHRDTTLATLVGFLLGSLTVVWPWKSVASERGGQLLMPAEFAGQVGEPHVIPALALMAFGLMLVIALEFIGYQLKHRESRQL